MKRATLAAFGALLGCLTLALAAQPVAGTVRSFELSQTALLDNLGEPGTAIRAYARVLDERNEPVFHLEGMGITGTLGEAGLVLRDIRSFQASSEGVAYIFLVDISRSLSEHEFGLIRNALTNWTEELRTRDRAAILAFGNESRLVVDFTNDVGRLTEGLAALGPTDNQTVFFEALQNGFELAKRRDPELPGRRVLIVLTDGRDEGSGWYLDDALSALRDDPIPIFAIGLSRIRDPQERLEYLQLLKRLATNSGGAFFEGSTQNLDSSYAAIREAIHRVWVLDFLCPDCARDGESYRLQASLSDGDRILTDGATIRLLPAADASAAAAALGPSSSAESMETSPLPKAGADSAGNDAVGSGPGDVSSGGSWLWFLLPLLAVAAGGWLLWSRRKPAPSAPLHIDSALPTDPASAPPLSPKTFKTPTGVETTRPPRPPKLRMVRLIVVRGNQPGKQYSMTLLDRAVVGSRSTCDCVLIDEPGIAAEQFELVQVDGNVYVRNLGGSLNPTLMDGLPIEEKQRIQSDSLVGTRDFIVRLIFGEGRPTARG